MSSCVELELLSWNEERVAGGRVEHIAAPTSILIQDRTGSSQPFANQSHSMYSTEQDRAAQVDIPRGSEEAECIDWL